MVSARSMIEARYPPLGAVTTHHPRSTLPSNSFGPTRSSAVSRSKRVMLLPEGSGNERASDDHSLDLRGALEDRVDLRVAVPLLYREILYVAVTTENLNREIGDSNRCLPGFQLRHRPLRLFKGLSRCRHPRGPINE